MNGLARRVREEISRAIVGLDEPVMLLLTAAVAGGHVLLDGMPGVGKTLLATSLGHSMAMDVKRVQFTPDLTPDDMTGAIGDGPMGREFMPGPLFTNILIADEINRASSLLQSSLLEAMQEGQVSLHGHTYPLPDPFMVIATKNPIDLEGTHPLTEAQIDRFMLTVWVDYLSESDEVDLLFGDHGLVGVGGVMAFGDLAKARREAAEVELPIEMARSIVALVRTTRSMPQVRFGGSPRAAMQLLQAARAVAWVEGRSHLMWEDVVRIAPAVLRHRVRLTSDSELAGVTPEQVVASALARIPAPAA
jgi:MoxR-like ATPase